MVLAVNCPPQAPAPGQAAHSNSFSCASVILPLRVSANGFVNVLNRDGMPFKLAGRDGAPVKHKTRNIQARQAP